MTATTCERLSTFAGYYPQKVFYPMRANTLAKMGWIACIDSSGNCTYGGGTGAGNAVGVFENTVDNRTTAPLGGAAGAESGEVKHGLHKLLYTGSAPKPGDVLFVVDNQTVSTDSDSGTRGIAGQAIEVDTALTTVIVSMGPHVVGMIAIGADAAADVATLQDDVADLEATAVAKKRVQIPLSAWTLGGAPMTAWVDGSANGLSLVDSEALGIRINPSALTLPVLVTSVPLPLDLDLTEDVTVHFSACRIGASDTAVVLEGAAFVQAVGAAYDADSDAITADTAALDSATKVAKELSFTIAAADLPASVDASITLTATPSAALDADDLVILSTWIEYTPAITAAA